jgi:hypothetical protein
LFRTRIDQKKDCTPRIIRQKFRNIQIKINREERYSKKKNVLFGKLKTMEKIFPPIPKLNESSVCNVYAKVVVSFIRERKLELDSITA